MQLQTYLSQLPKDLTIELNAPRQQQTSVPPGRCYKSVDATATIGGEK